MTTATGTGQTYFDDVTVGQEIELKLVPTTQQLVQWAAGSGDFYQIHYDTDFAKATGLPASSSTARSSMPSSAGCCTSGSGMAGGSSGGACPTGAWTIPARR